MYYYVYLLLSEKDDNFYVGFTDNIKKRVLDHNSGKVKSTRNRRPFKLVYWEGCLNKKDALRREKYLKSTWGKRYIKKRIDNFLNTLV